MIFHIGLEKTGTDSFQRFCREQTALLKRHATLYPTRSLAFGVYNHEPLVACYLDYHDFSIRSAGRPRADVLRSLMAEIDAASLPKVLISGEHFSSRFRQAEIARLAADFAGFACTIAVVVREHRARLYSAYSQAVLSGRDMTLDAYCDEVFDPANWYMRYATTIGAWEAAFGRENVMVFRHARGQDIIPVLAAGLISPDIPMGESGRYWDNLSMGPTATERLRRINSAVNGIPGASAPAIRRALRGPRRNLARLLARLAGTNDKGRPSLSTRNERRLADIAEADDAWLERRYGIRPGEAARPAVTATR
ncbi:MAG TPA: hypothetical protein VG651_01220 [Stellaceae bacterium]|nr:hypothetical protein [Stellaceae bacterium]